MRRKVSAGDVYGRWTVQNEWMTNEKGQRKWLCRCECGSERYVLERGLLYGGSTSCGCLARERAGRRAAQGLEGMTFGMLTVLEPSDRRAANGTVLWKCRCECGNVCELPGTQLKAGKYTHCGCQTAGQRRYVDIAGRVFHRLTALYPVDRRDGAGYMMWRCRCECGNETEVSYNALMYGNVKSCGCRKREYVQTLSEHLTHVAGTSVEMLKSTKLPSNNTTGVKGVYLIKGKYVAKMVFQKKQYFLGTFDCLEDAKAARLAAEEEISQKVVEYYGRWKQRADADPVWAAEHPVSISVEKDPNNRMQLKCLPVIE